MKPCKHTDGDVIVDAHFTSIVLDAPFAGRLIDDEACAIGEDLRHLPIGIVNGLALRDGAVHLSALSKGELSCLLRVLAVTLVLQCKRETAFRDA